MGVVTVVNHPGQPYKNTITAGNHQVVVDATTNLGGQDAGPSPHDMLWGALGACTSMTMAMYAKRKGYDLQEIRVELSESKVQNPSGKGMIPHVDKKIIVKGNLSQPELDDLKRVAEKCPVNKLIMEPKSMGSTLNLVV